MIRARRLSIGGFALAVIFSLAIALLPDPLLAQQTSGTLQLLIQDATTGQPVPARVEIRGADGAYHVAGDALPSSGDCSMGDPGSEPVDQAASVPMFPPSAAG